MKLEVIQMEREMSCRFQLHHNGEVTTTELNELLATNNWQVSDTAKLESALAGSWAHLIARDSTGKLIGFVHVLSDGIFHAYVLRMIVHPDFRRNGVGSAIMTELMRVLSEANLRPTLAATPGNEKFYERFGFKRESRGIVAMCIR